MTKPKDPTGCLFISLCLGTVSIFLLWVSTRILEFVALIGFVFKGWGL